MITWDQLYTIRMPKSNTFSMSRSATIAAPAAVIRDLHKWEAWSPWQELDPQMNQSYSGEAAGVGAIMEWEGNKKAGSGRMTVVSDAPNLVEIDIEFLKPFPAKNRSHFSLADAGPGQTTVTWTMTGEQSLFMKVMFKVMRMEQSIGKDFARGLSRLASVLASAVG